jgi:hypothetical protein
MHAQLKWAAVAGLWLLALPTVLPSDARATDAPVPDECRSSNLSPEAQARCDFIARTPDLCRRSGLSEATRQFCDRLAGVPALPEECLRPDLSPQAEARCEFIARTPNLCQRSGLSRRTQLFCDQQRFADVPLFNVVRLAANGAVRSIRLIETASGRAVYTGYPYGIAFAASDPRDRELRMRVEDLAPFLDGRPTPGSGSGSRRAAAPISAQAAPTGFATGLPIGLNPSTGITPGQCLNYTINTPSNNVEQASFSSQSTASSTSSQINVSATVSGGVDGFKASDTFSYSDQYQSSTISTNQYYNFYSLYTLNSSVSGSDPLSTQGQNAGTGFGTLCGSEYLSAVTVGMVATLSINYGSTSSSTQTEVSNSLSASEGLDSISTAVSTANSATNSSSYFTFNMNSYGGGTGATTDLNSAFAQTNASGEAYYASCAAGNTDDCSTFSGNMGDGASNALSSFNALVDGLSGATNPDISFFETFPNGVAGADTSAPVALSIPIATSDLLEPYSTQLSTYLTLLNEIATLNNRTLTLLNKVGQPDFNPTSFLDVASYLEELEDDLYDQDRITLLDNLENCLAATEDNLTTVCAPIIDNTIANAYQWYDTDGQNPNFFARQNTIALQYTGLLTYNNGSSWPQDVVYLQQLPSWSNVNEFFLIGGQAALVGFADAAYVNGGATETGASLAFLPLEPSADLSEVTTEVFTTQGTPPPGLWFGYINGGASPATNDGDQPLEWLGTTETCAPSFAFPCPIGYGLEPGALDYPLSFQMTQIDHLFTPE